MRIRAIPFVSALILIAVISGCGAPTPTPTSSSTPSAESVPHDVPQSALQLSCATAVPSTIVNAALGRPDAQVSDLDADRGVTTYELVERQAGVQSCDWGRFERDSSAGFSVFPDAAGAYQELSGRDEVNQQYLRTDELGDSSTHRCEYGYCFADVLVADFWMAIHVYRPDLMDERDLEPLFLDFADAAIAAVRTAAADAREPWVAPAGSFRPVTGCSDALVSEVGAVLGRPNLYPTGTDGFGGFQVEIWKRTGLLWCTLADDDDLGSSGNLEVLPGAAWALPELLGSAWESTSYEGVPDAPGGPMLVASDASGTAVIAEIDGSLLFFSFEGVGRDELLDSVPGVIDVLRGYQGP